MRILLTGATGFIGAHLAPQLEAEGHEVYCFERYVTGRPAASHRFRTVFGDLRSYFQVSRAIEDARPEVVIHLASISPVSYSYENPFDVQAVNYIGTVNLAEACLRLLPALEQFIFASTSETFGNVAAPMTEDSQQIPNSPYSASKLAAENYLKYLEATYDFPLTILRPFNTYGRKNDRHFFIESLVTQMLGRKKEIGLGDPNIVRDFLYVDDHVAGYLKALGKLHQSINLCTGIGYHLSQVAMMAKEITCFDGEIKWETIPRRPNDIKELWGRNEKAKLVLNWTPEVSLQEGLEKVVKYWREENARTSWFPLR